MNVLIVNAYGDIENKKFKEFISVIKDLFKKNKIDDINYIIVDSNEIDKVDHIHFTINNSNLFENNCYNLSEDSKLFNKHSNIVKDIPIHLKLTYDNLDLIFIDGFEKNLPWKKPSKNFLQFFRECKNKNKKLFVANVGLQILTFFLATNFRTDINIINSSEKSSESQSIETINKIGNNLKNLKKNDLFLDYITGDLYEYNYNKEEWVPVMNIGLHKDNLTKKYNDRGKYISNEKFFSNKLDKLYNLPSVYSEETTQVKCHIQKQYKSHWLMNNIPNDFIVNSSCSWFSHNFSLKNAELQYSFLCNSIKGPMVIEHQNSIGIAFHILKKNTISVKILENFIIYRSTQIKPVTNNMITTSTTDTQIDIFMKKYKHVLADKKEQAKIDQNTKSIELVKSSRPFSKIKNGQSHVGVNCSQRNMIYVDNNAVNSQSLIIHKEMNDNDASDSYRYSQIADSDKITKLRKLKDDIKNKKIRFSQNELREYLTENELVDNKELNLFIETKQNQSKINSKSSYDQKMLNNLNINGNPYKQNENEQLISQYYINKRREITGELIGVEYSNRNIDKNKNSFNRFSTSRPKSSKSNPNFSSQDKIKSKSENVPSNSEINSDSEYSSYIEPYNTFSMMFPYVRQEDFPKPINKHILWSGFDKEKEGKDVIHVNLSKKNTNNYNKLYKKYEKDLIWNSTSTNQVVNE